jgi:PAS domain S-box-containing protein
VMRIGEKNISGKKMKDQEKKALVDEITSLRERIADMEQKKEALEDQTTALYESEKMFREISENSPLAIMIYQNNKWVYANSAASIMSGYTNEELKEMNFWDFVHPDYMAKVKSIGIKRQNEQETIQNYEFKIISKNGKEKWVWLSGSATIFEGKPAGIISVQDISARKIAEQKLRESEERFKFLTKATFEGIVVHNNGIVLDANDAFIKLSGYTRKEVIGQFLLDYIPGMKDRAKVLINIAKGSAKPYWVEGKRKDGSYFIAELEAKNVKQSGKPVRIVAVRDVTKRQEAQEQLKIAHKKLKTMNSILRHDIANDLAVIESALTLYRDTSNTDMLDEIERRMKRSIDTIKKQYNQESDINEIESPSVIVINDLFAEIIQNHPEIEITVSGEEGIQVFSDEGLHSVFENFISNALRHGRADHINIEIIKQGKECEIRFADNGSGIPDNIKARIFNEGFHHGDSGNTGIGLYIVKSLIDSYNGRIRIEDNQPQGAVFVISLACNRA